MFKKRDRVRVCSKYTSFSGREGEVVDFIERQQETKQYIRVKFDNSSEFRWFLESELRKLDEYEQQ